MIRRLVIVTFAMVPQLVAQSSFVFNDQALGYGSTPSSFAAGDLDGDFDVDVACVEGGDLFVARALGLGAFASPEVVGSAAPTGHVAIGDLDGDGVADLVTSNPSAGLVEVFLGDGVGGFAPPVATMTAPGITRLAVADLTADGRSDVVTHTLDAVLVLPGLGDGTFGDATTVAVSGPIADLEIADLDADTFPDVVVALDPGDVHTLLGDGVGLLPPAAVPGTADARDVAIGDVDADHVPDLAVATPSGIVIRLGDGDGTFTRAPSLAAIDPAVVALVDLDVDGHLDLVTVEDENKLLTFAGQGGGAFGPPVLSDSILKALALGVADVDGDLREDVLAIYSKHLLFMLNAGDGVLYRSRTVATDLTFADEVAIGDLNGDGLGDVVTSSDIDLGGFGVNEVYVSLQRRDGSFAPPTSYTMGSGTEDMAMGDLDEDGRLDVFAVNCYSNTLSVRRGNGDGTLGAKVDVSTAVCPEALGTGDFDGDGHLDVVVGTGCSSTVQAFLGDGDGSLTSQAASTGLGSIFDLDVGDVDGDGVLDVVLGRFGGNAFASLRGVGDGTFTMLDAVFIGQGAWSVSLGDANADGHLDAALGDVEAGDVRILRGEGDGRLTPWITLPMSGAVDLEFFDADGAGGMDLATAWYSGPNTVSILSFDDVGLTSRWDLPFGNPDKLATGHLDDDGLLDLVISKGESSVHAVHHAPPHPWTDLGDGLSGVGRAPRLLGFGTGQGGTAVTLTLAGAAPGAPTTLVVGATTLGAPFKGGTLVPSPDVVVPGLTTGPAGTLVVDGRMPPSVPVDIVFQAWVLDPGGPAGLAASNGLGVTVD